MTTETLTGNFRFRQMKTAWSGTKIVLEVEYVRRSTVHDWADATSRTFENVLWRDAKPDDFITGGLRIEAQSQTTHNT